MNYKDYIADIPDFPQDGILFRDVTPLMADGDVFKKACDEIIAFAKEVNAEVVVGPESRGFIFGCPVAYELGIGFVPVRKPGKLPRETVSVSYDLEYGSNELQVHKDSIKKGQRVLIVDDLLATGGTVDATIQMVKELGGVVAGCAFLIELAGLNGREHLKEYPVFALMSYE
ncbi:MULTISPECIES: adenine phosphoribosyltransferase [Bacillota]|jgi:adenine phosphoribosyltransferase|uniref:Adenine phosphoribosyltransferase n=2 Tax=Amedibacillus TaxID=2749846 RepID=A0A7G9GM29_9FIRM|nr:MULTISPECIES: adenine phosphoribosyltransferase [Bacillota]QNM11861.1 adenine phosphoribosyltransferase [[Eubacterium] hominis]MCH4287216.1 adenine phosphoribosyltransferase [Amedibacillus hominis]RGB50630.1 adenine phosphoribosyltransferase [Absiella sp. AM22-9]RGB62907.1 adenine phosphoribosyltransferase [Absiella sp. AM10-20]RGB64832.1 adenine phosphoribosyltransferase [Absiella sp. AM09-45]